MLCQDCKKREAQVHFTQIINNEKQSLSLCRNCADARGFHSPLDNMPFPLADILSGLAANIPNLEKETEAVENEEGSVVMKIITYKPCSHRRLGRYCLNSRMGTYYSHS